MPERVREPAQIDLSLNENPFETLPWVELVRREIEPAWFFRYRRDGRLKERLCRHHGVSGDSLYVYPGAEGALLAVTGSFFARSRAGRGVLLADPGWHYFRETADRFGLRTITFALANQGEAYAFPCDEIVGLTVKARPAVVLIDSPNNPAGCSLDDAGIRRIHASMNGDQILAIDEAYFGYSRRRDNRGELVREMDDLLIIRSFSKYYGLAGLRIGYVLAGKGARAKLALADTLLGLGAFAERLACLALDDAAPFERAARAMEAQREALSDSLRRLGCLVPLRSAANFVPVEIREGCLLSASSYAEFAANRGVKLRLFPGGRRGGLVRITVGTAQQMARLEALSALYVSLGRGAGVADGGVGGGGSRRTCSRCGIEAR